MCTYRTNNNVERTASLKIKLDKTLLSIQKVEELELIIFAIDFVDTIDNIAIYLFVANFIIFFILYSSLYVVFIL